MRKVVFGLVAGVSLVIGNTSYSYRIVGDYKCDDLLNNTEHEYFEVITKSWAAGYVSGRNYSENRRKTSGMKSVQKIQNTLYSSILKYCRENLSHTTSDAMWHIYNNELY